MTPPLRGRFGPAPRRLALLVAAALSGSSLAAQPTAQDAWRPAITFERNDGQFAPEALFVSHGMAGRIAVGKDSIAIAPRARGGLETPLRVRFAGAREPVVEAADPRATRSHHYTGSDPANHRENIPHFGRVALKGLYRDIDLAVYGKEGALEYDFIVAPGSDPRQIRLDLSAADQAWIDAEGALRMRLGDHEFLQRAPIAYQERDGQRVAVAARFEVYASDAGSEAGFVLGDYDRGRELVIDPVLAFSTYLGANGDWSTPVKVDPQGNLYFGYSGFVGQYVSTVVKFNPAAQQVVYSTTFNGQSMIRDLAIGASGAGQMVAVAGSTNTNFFPHCFAGTDCANYGGGANDAFVTLLNANGNIAYSRLLGGTGDDQAFGVALDANGVMHVAGSTTGTIPTTGNAPYPNRSGTDADAFMAKLTVAGGLVYGTYLGGTGNDTARGIALDGAGGIYVAGSTRSGDFPTMNPYQPSFGGGFVTKFSGGGTAVAYSTFLGGSGDNVTAIVVDPASNEAIVTGDTGLPTFPQTGTVRPFGGTVDTFVTRFTAAGNALQASAMFGGTFYDTPNAMALAPNGDVFVTGYSSGSGLPQVDPLQGGFGGGSDAFITRVRGGEILFSSYLGGSGTEYGTGVGVDASGAVYVMGRTTSGNFPTTPGAYHTSYTAPNDMFLAKITFPASLPNFNADGNADLLFANEDGRAAIWTMNGLAPTATAEIIGAGTGWSVAHIADFNADGKTDLVWQHTDGRMAIYLMNGTTPTTTTQLLNAGSGWSVKHTPDLNGDGKADLVFENTDGSAAVWLMNGAAMTSGASIIGPGTGWKVTKTADFDGDGRDDLLWTHTDGRAAIWVMNGTGVFYTMQILNAGSGWSAIHTPDLNGDGKADIVWQHTDGRVALWLMNGGAMASGAGLLGPGTDWSVTRTADFNGDGKADLFFLHTDGRAAIYLMNGLAPTSTAQILNAGGGWSARRLLDLNGDGKADIVWQNVDGSTALWLMNGTTMSASTQLFGTGTGWSVSGVSQ